MDNVVKDVRTNDTRSVRSKKEAIVYNVSWGKDQHDCMSMSRFRKKNENFEVLRFILPVLLLHHSILTMTLDSGDVTLITRISRSKIPFALVLILLLLV